ncbi:MAG: aldo/keto reductase [Oscillospiraceae bacterium]|nr:aldo/keto reductase [Oscillospiraceae bacterium]
MLYHQFQDLKLSALGFGTMRLPLLPDGTGTIDREEVDRMVDAAMAAGVNYYDTAYPYHGGNSETVVGRSLSRYPRESWYLADKFPGHQNVKGVTPLRVEDVFEDQLRKCGTDYFDFYLLHNVNENSMYFYGPHGGEVIGWLLEQKEKGRIRHLGFSCHGAPECLAQFLEKYGGYMEFCQIQLNYVDWTLQDAAEKCRILKEAGIPVWVMEPVRGGKLAKFSPETEARMKALRPEESIAAWAFRWLMTLPQPTMVLSGMSDLDQMKDNLRTFSEEKPLSAEEIDLLGEVAAGLAELVPCTGCRYCCAGCPVGLDIPVLMSFANEVKMGSNLNTVMRYSSLGKEKQAAACVGCGQCVRACPQNIRVPEEMRRLDEILSRQKSWDEICRERAAAAAAGKEPK